MKRENHSHGYMLFRIDDFVDCYFTRNIAHVLIGLQYVNLVVVSLDDKITFIKIVYAVGSIHCGRGLRVGNSRMLCIALSFIYLFLLAYHER